MSQTSITTDFYLARELFLGDGPFRLILDNLRKNTTLSFFDAVECELNDKDTIKLSSALFDKPYLKKVNFGRNYIGDIGLSHLMGPLQTNTTLETLYFHNNKLQHESCRLFSSFLQNTQTLLHLNLEFNKLGDIGAFHLAEGLRGNNTLINLNVRYCDIGDKGAKDFASVLSCNTSLRELCLSWNFIKKAGRRALKETLQYNSSLKFLALYNDNDSAQKRISYYTNRNIHNEQCKQSTFLDLLLSSSLSLYSIRKKK